MMQREQHHLHITGMLYLVPPLDTSSILATCRCVHEFHEQKQIQYTQCEIHNNRPSPYPYNTWRPNYILISKIDPSQSNARGNSWSTIPWTGWNLHCSSWLLVWFNYWKDHILQEPGTDVSQEAEDCNKSSGPANHNFFKLLLMLHDRLRGNH